MVASLCLVCKAEIFANSGVCISCGAPLGEGAPAAGTNALPVGSKLQGGNFSIGRVLARGDTCITYLGSDSKRSCAVAINEFFPPDCSRWSNLVMPAESWTDQAYDGAKKEFIKEGQTLGKLKHAGIVQVAGTFEENNTSYVVLEYLTGKALSSLVKEQGTLPEREAVEYIEEVSKAVEEVKKANLPQRYIRPDNLVVTYDGRLVWICFGAAGDFSGDPGVGGRAGRGYAAPEQNGKKLEEPGQVYSMAATLYHLLTGEPPVPATERAAGVTLPDVRDLNPQVSEGVAQAVMSGLALEDRPDSVRAFVDSLAYAAAVAVPDNLAAPLPGSGRLEGHRGSVSAVGFSPSGKTLASGGDDGTVRLWVVGTRREEQKFEGHVGPVCSVAFNPDGSLIASGSWDTTVRLWSIDQAQEARRLEGHTDWVRSVSFSPDGTVMASGGNDNRVIFWNIATGAQVRRLEGHTGPVSCIAYSPDGTLLASGSEDNSVRLWSVDTAQEAFVLEGHTDWVRSVAFTTDSVLLASGSDDGKIWLWDATSGEPAVRLEGHGGPVTGIAFHPEGRLLVSAGEDNTLRLWNVNTGEEMRRMEGHTGPVLAVAFSPDGKLLASASWDETVRVWTAAEGDQA